jgi:FkbM family methyltransferase
MNENQEILLNKFNAAVTQAQRSNAVFMPRPEHMGNSMNKRVKRLLRYRSTYIKYILDRIKTEIKSFFKLTVTVTTFFGTTTNLPISDSNVQSIYKDGILSEDEDGLIRFLIKELKAEDIFYDIGANYGFYSALAQKIITTGQIHIFEPNTSIFPYLQKMVSLKENVSLNKIALSDSIGEITFFDCYEGHSSGKSTTVEGVAKDHRAGYKKVSIQATTLDEYCKSHTVPTVIKIDVEGAESAVLEGGKETLKIFSPTIAIELWSGTDLSEYSLKTVKFLDSLGYTPFFLLSTGDTKQTDVTTLMEWLKVRQTETNFIFRKVTSAI